MGRGVGAFHNYWHRVLLARKALHSGCYSGDERTLLGEFALSRCGSPYPPARQSAPTFKQALQRQIAFIALFSEDEDGINLIGFEIGFKLHFPNA